MSDSLKISVALAACRGERHIGAQLRSLLGQTRPPDEIIICDDSPDDRTAAAVEAVSPPDGRVRCFRNPRRLGVNGNFNRALELCTGDLLFCCDQDDVWLPEKIEKLSALFAADSRLVLAFCDSRLVDGNLKGPGRSLLAQRGCTPSVMAGIRRGDGLAAMLRCVVASGHNLAFRPGRFRSILLPVPEMRTLFYDSYLPVAAAACGKIAVLPEILTLHRRHDGNSSCGRGGWRAARQALATGALEDYCICFRTLEERLAAAGMPVPPLLRARREFAEARLALDENFFRRFGSVLRLELRGDYRRFGRGWKTLGADLLLR